MIWKINMDTTDELSLLKAIYDTVRKPKRCPGTSTKRRCIF
ncbi:MAG: hypothetical protein HPY66_1118 [Firmicutes bacterium]|nr:hypothetical protein [Bacillota bacterium]MDI6707420.1 hypothetical protein [Bacillota bacterium]